MMDVLEKELTKVSVSYKENETWRYCFFDNNIPTQGWKIHISSQMKDCIKIFKIVSTVMKDEKCNFKVAKNIEVLKCINSPRETTAIANKYITIYPSDAEKSKKMILLLHEKLADFQAPRILSDFSCGNNSPVHYRYGGYKSIKKYNESTKEIVFLIKDGYGNLIEDKRVNYPTVPEGIEDLFSETEKAKYFTPDEQIEDSNAINNYSFEKILKKSNRGNVYLARIKSNNQKVIIKQARKFISNDLNGEWFAIDELKNEARILKQLESKKFTAKLVDEFYAAGDYFIVQTYINGISNKVFSDAKYISKFAREKFVNQLVSIVNEIHKEGLAIVDLAPGNLIYSMWQLYLIDLENVTHIDSKKRRVETPFMINPDSKKSDSLLQQDYFSLSMVSFAILTGTPMIFGKKDDYLSISALDKIKIILYHSKTNGLIDDTQYEWLLYLLKISCKNEYVKVKKLRKSFIKDTVSENNHTLTNMSHIVLDEEKRKIITYLLKQQIKETGRITPSTAFGEYVSPVSFQHGLSGQIFFIVNNTNKESLQPIREWVSTVMPIIDSQQFKYNQSLLFGNGGFLFSLLLLYEKTKDTYYLKCSEKIANQIIKNYDKEHCNDFALGKSGMLLSLLKYAIITKNPRICQFIYNKITPLSHALENRKSFCKLVDYSFAHGYSGIAYLLYSYAKVFQTDEFDDLLSDYYLEIEEFVYTLFDTFDRKKSIGKDTKGADMERLGLVPVNQLRNLELSWCEGLSGLLLYMCMVSEKNVDLIKKVQEVISNQHLKMLTSYCHGLSSLMQTLNYRENQTVKNKIFDFILTRSYRNENDLLVFYGDQLGEHLFDFGTGTLGVYWTLSNMKFPFEL